jgi:aconitate hydratase
MCPAVVKSGERNNTQPISTNSIVAPQVTTNALSGATSSTLQSSASVTVPTDQGIGSTFAWVEWGTTSRPSGTGYDPNTNTTVAEVKVTGADLLGLSFRHTQRNAGAVLPLLWPAREAHGRAAAVRFPTLDVLRAVQTKAKAQGLWRDADTPPAEFTGIIEIDLSAVEPCVSGPSRPQDRVPLGQAPAAFRNFLGKGKDRPAGASLKDGDVVIAAITSCTNTSNPSVMIGAGVLARNALARGLKPRPWVKTSLSPGSRVVADYLAKSGLQDSLDALGFHTVGFGCMTCMGNSGPLPEPVAQAIEAGGVTAVAVLSGNRNFEGRIHPSVRASFLASPPLVVAYALAGSVLVDLASEPLGEDREGRPVYLHEVWPDGAEIRRITDAVLAPALYTERYATIAEGPPQWRSLGGETGTTFPWKAASTFIRRPPFFDDMAATPEAPADIRGARVLAMFGDMFTTDHISPIGAISAGTPAAEYLGALGIAPRDFVNYAARRLNHDVMIRGTFASTRARNEMTPEVEGSCTVHHPHGSRMPIHAAAERYREAGVPLVVIAGAEYGTGSSRDWAAKGTRLLGVRAVIAESFERIHRSNLVGMGVLPLQFKDGMTRKTLNLTGHESFDVSGIDGALKPGMDVPLTIHRRDGASETITLTCRIDTLEEVEYFKNGGVLHYVLRNLAHAA